MSNELNESPTDNNSPTDSCAVCHVPAQLFCSACKLVKYCGADHQRQHWKQHKPSCRPFRIASDALLGRHLTATRPIAAGSLIFSEAPLIVGPKWYLTDREKEKVPVMPCVGCFTPCRMDANHCPKCRWPACSASCAGLENPNLHGLECPILMLGPGPASRTDLRSLTDYYRSDALVVLKCLLLQRQQKKKWTELMDMQSHEEEREGSELKRDADKRIVSYLQKNFLERLQHVEQKSKEKYLQEYDATVLHRICGIIETNYMCINLPTGLELSGVYYTACMMEHACRPNCYFQFNHRNGFKISVVAGRKIERGEHLKIMYSNMLWGTQLRLEHLAITKHFLCRCDRCSDPSEYGTYFSAMRCMGDGDSDCGGMHLPKDPLSTTTDWACNECPIEISGEEVRYLLTQMADEVDNLLVRKPSLQRVEALIEKLSKFLHPNHYHLFSLKHSLIQLYGTEAGYTLAQLNAAQLEKKMLTCQELYAVCQKLDPDTIRLSIYVGIILYEMHTVLVEQSKRLLAKTDVTQPEDLELINAKLKLAHDHLLEAVKILEKELDNVAGSKLSEAVISSIVEVEDLINSLN